MARMPRLKVKGEAAVYHVTSRIVGRERLLGKEEKDHLLGLLKRFSKLYFVEVIGFAIMSNHFHLLVRMLPGDDVSDEEIRERFARHYGRGKKFPPGRNEEYYRRKWADISELVRDLKQNFSRWFNKRHGRTGYLWGDRFKSSIIERGEGLWNCVAYVDLNPVRAGMVKRPEAYAWSSIGYLVRTRNQDALVHHELLGLEGGVEAQLASYRRLLYHVGVQEREGAGSIPREAGLEGPGGGWCPSMGESLLQRVSHFENGLVIGSRPYVAAMISRFSCFLRGKRTRRPLGLKEGSSLFSLRRAVQAAPTP